MNPERAKQEKSRWEKILTYTTLGKEHQKHRIGANPGNRQEELEQLYKSRYDYRKFLKKFAFSKGRKSSWMRKALTTFSIISEWSTMEICL